MKNLRVYYIILYIICHGPEAVAGFISTHKSISWYFCTSYFPIPTLVPAYLQTLNLPTQSPLPALLMINKLTRVFNSVRWMSTCVYAYISVNVYLYALDSTEVYLSFIECIIMWDDFWLLSPCVSMIWNSVPSFSILFLPFSITFPLFRRNTFMHEARVSSHTRPAN